MLCPMIYTCEFNPVRDIQATVPDMAVDLAGAIESGVVLDTGMIAEHNEIDSPASILGRVSDVFDAFEAQKRILAAGRTQQPATASVSTGNSDSQLGANS